MTAMHGFKTPPKEPHKIFSILKILCGDSTTNSNDIIVQRIIVMGKQSFGGW